MITDGLYWFFGSSAQSIAAFLALLLTGFALILTLMDSALRRDETLLEIHTSLRRRHYRGVIVTSALLMGAALMSLAIVALRAWGVSLPDWIHFTVFVLVLTSLATGTVFVLWIVDPSKYEKAARRLLDQQQPQRAALPTAAVGSFMATFIEIESRLRRLADDAGLLRSSRGVARFPSLPDIIEVLQRRDYLDSALARELFDLSKYRNLVAHGEESVVDRRMLDMAEGVLRRVEGIPVHGETVAPMSTRFRDGEGRFDEMQGRGWEDEGDPTS
jgi:hypothetical protein